MRGIFWGFFYLIYISFFSFLSWFFGVESERGGGGGDKRLVGGFYFIS